MIDERLLKKEQLINNLGDNYPTDRYNTAQRLNVYEIVTRYGKVSPRVTGNTRIGESINQLPIHTFGSIGQYIIDTLPNSFMSRNAVEKTEIRTDNLKFRKQQIVNRRFICNVLSTWGYIMGISYKNTIKMWAKDIDYTLPKKHYAVIDKKVKENGYIKTYKVYVPERTDKELHKTTKCLSGQEVLLMIRDIIFLIRNSNLKDMEKDLVDNATISAHLGNRIYDIIHDKTLDKNQKEKKIKAIKDKVYITYQSDTQDLIWTFPKYNVQYLIGLIKELQSGDYLMDIYVPVINNLKKYPIECKDTHLKPMNDEQHNKNKDDYDISQYIWEDY